MPAAALASIAKEAGVSLARAEHVYDVIKKSMTKAGKEPGKDVGYGYLMNAVKHALGLSQEEFIRKYGEWRPHPVDEMESSFKVGDKVIATKSVILPGGGGFGGITYGKGDPANIVGVRSDGGYDLSFPLHHPRFRYGGTCVLKQGDVHFFKLAEEITTTANLAPGNIARTSPNEEAPHVCTNCGYGSSGDEGGTCPKCGGRMAERAKWIRELIDRVQAGESASQVLNKILR